MIILIFKLPSTIFAPASVEDITDGILARVDMAINLKGFIGSNPGYIYKQIFRRSW